MAEFPNGVYTPRDKENKSGVVYTPANKTLGYAEDVVFLDEEVVAIETELGENPKGAKADVKTRLNDVDTDIADRYTKDEVDSLVGGANFAFFYTDQASDLGSTFIADENFPAGAETNIQVSSLGVGDDQLLFRFATNVGQPTFPTIRAGSIEVHGHYERFVGGRTVNLYAVIKERKADTSEVIVATTEISGEVTAKGPVTMHATLTSDYEFDSSDSRLILEVYANIIGGGADVSIVSSQEGETGASFSVTTTIGALDSKYFGKTAEGEIEALTLDSTPADNSVFMMEDADNSFAKVKLNYLNFLDLIKTSLIVHYVGFSAFYNHSDRHDSGGADEITGAGLQIQKAIEFFIDGGGSAITTGIKGSLTIPFKCEITSITMVTDQSGSIVVDIWKDTFANYPPTDADSITASAPPTIETALKTTDATLTDWTKTINAGDILTFNVDSITDVEWASLVIKIKLIV